MTDQSRFDSLTLAIDIDKELYSAVADQHLFDRFTLPYETMTCDFSKDPPF
jgi:hypothetical protein